MRAGKGRRSPAAGRRGYKASEQMDSRCLTLAESARPDAVVVELPYAGTSWLVREILRGAGDLVVLEPDDARAAIAKEVAG